MTPVALDRLRDGRDVAAVLRTRRQRAGRLVVVHARRREDDGAPRIAVVASRRVGKAVTRNRAKRLLREAARLMEWRPGTDLVLVARAAAGSSTRDEVLAELRGLAQVLGVTGDGTGEGSDHPQTSAGGGRAVA